MHGGDKQAARLCAQRQHIHGCWHSAALWGATPRIYHLHGTYQPRKCSLLL